MMEADLVLRGATLGLALLLAATLWRDRGGVPAAVFSLLALSLACFVALGMGDWAQPFRTGLAAIAFAGGFFFWLFSRVLFEDGFRPQLWHGLLLFANQAALLAWLLLRASLDLANWRVALLLIPLAFVADALWRVWRDRRSDLVDERNRARLLLLFTAGSAAAAKIAAAILLRPAQWPDGARLADAMVSAGLLLAGAMIFTQFRPHILPPAAAPVLLPPDDPDAFLATRLEQAMRQEEKWRQPGLTIGALAAHLGIAEYRLRRLLNGTLGYRNFTTFLNSYRLDAAAQALADPAKARLPILTIAFDTGWNSIGPFNRAFRARHGMTPSEYRQSPKAEKTF